MVAAVDTVTGPEKVLLPPLLTSEPAPPTPVPLIVSGSAVV